MSSTATLQKCRHAVTFWWTGRRWPCLHTSPPHILTSCFLSVWNTNICFIPDVLTSKCLCSFPMTVSLRKPTSVHLLAGDVRRRACHYTVWGKGSPMEGNCDTEGGKAGLHFLLVSSVQWSFIVLTGEKQPCTAMLLQLHTQGSSLLTYNVFLPAWWLTLGSVSLRTVPWEGLAYMSRLSSL